MTVHVRRSTRRPRALAAALAAATVALAGCGGDSSSTTSTAATFAPEDAPARAGEIDVERVDADEAEEATGGVTLCAGLADVRRLLPAVRAFDAGSERFLASTIGFPDDDGAPTAAFEAGQRAKSPECDLFLAPDADVALRLAGAGRLVDVAPAVKTRAATSRRPRCR
jgi:hypothetical protein